MDDGGNKRPTPHFVLCLEDKSPAPGWKNWQDKRPTLNETTRHVTGGGKAGIVPASVDCVVIDCDGGHFQRVQDDLRERGIPFKPLPSSKDGNGHVWIRSRNARDGGWLGNSKWGQQPPKDRKDDETWPHPYGEIRSDSGYVACRGYSEFSAVAFGVDLDATEFTRRDLDNLYGGNGLHRRGEDSDGETHQRRVSYQDGARATDGQLKTQLAHIAQEHCDDYDDWIRCLAAIKDECGEAGRETARQWSRQSPKFDEKGFNDAWNSLSGAAKGSGRKVTWGTLTDLAGGFNAKVDGRGRPRSGEPSAEARRQRRARAQGKADEAVAELGLPPWCAASPHEQRDGERILHFQRHRLRRCVGASGVIYALIADSDGLWHDLDHRRKDYPVAAVKDALDEARDATAAYLVEKGKPEVAQALTDSHPNTAAYWKAMAHHVAIHTCSGKSGVETISEGDLNDRDTHGVIPLKGGGAWSLRENRLLSADDVVPMLLLASGWSIPPPDMETLKSDTPPVQAMKRAIAGRFAGVFERLAMRFAGTSKTMDMIHSPLSNYGKSTLVDVIERVTPGAMRVMQGKNAFSPQGTKFDALASSLCNGNWLTVVDEVEKGPGDTPLKIDSSVIVSLTGKRLSIEEKGEKEREKRRTGTAMLLGADWPYIPADAQGMDTRLTWCLELDGDKHGKLSRSERELLLAPDAIEYLRAYLFKTAHELTLADDAAKIDPGKLDSETLTATERSRAGTKDFFEVRANPIVAALKANYQEDPKGSVSAKDITATIKEICEAEGLDEPKSNQRGIVIRQAFPKAHTKRRGGSTNWYGFSKIGFAE